MKKIICITISVILLSTSGLAVTNEIQELVGKTKIDNLTQAEAFRSIKDVKGYYSSVKKLINHHKDKAKDVSSRNELRKIMRTLMKKDNCAYDYEARGVFYENEIAKTLSKEMSSCKSDYVENLLLLANYIGHVRGEMIPNFKWLTVYANVSPPPSGVPGMLIFSGMNPDVIPDPEIRKKYLERIEKNNQNNRTNSRQSLFEDANRRHTRELLKHIEKAFIHSERDMDLLLECVIAARLSQEEIELICKKLDLNGNERKVLCDYEKHYI